MSDRPDFLVIMTDQHRWDWLGCNGHSVLRTPHIDSLAQGGTSFGQYFVASPVCMPNRASFMTGRYPSVHGLRYNGCHLPLTANTFVDVLRAAGYQTASVGKSHLQPMIDKTVAPKGKTGSIAEAWKTDFTAYGHEQPSRYSGTENYDLPLPYYGFDHIDMVTRHGTEASGHYRQWLRRNYPNAAENPLRQLPHNYTCPQALRTDIPEDAYPTAYIRDSAVRHLQANADNEDPLFTFVSFPDPHHPFNPPGRYWDMYNPDQFALGPRFADHVAPPPPLMALYEDFVAGRAPDARTFAFMAREQHLREAMALTAGMIAMIDDAVGAILSALEESGRRDRTVVIFTSDHGDYLGDSDLLLKGPWMRDSINRVPLIWNDPDLSQLVARNDALASTVDIAPSILARAGLLPYAGMQGRSFLAELQGDRSLARASLLIEYNDANMRFGYSAPARIRSLVTDDWALRVPGGESWGELYDRRRDPDQVKNLWDAPDHAETRRKCTAQLLDHLIAQMDESPRARHPA
ncbi:sulfatase [Roseinatronobacter alkalisoli]|uniref:Sulfatase-like hydrolase/transferase n=1 Tax=Roseinatronobacter alkalisoli TaxID=3028235 RepID=A0ABT5TAL0_9RHOB|nr:sulfatase-like hydrolase/transferase [Roseinatronobacter sp. HJB301]MDD7972163.1 sulfatase-like hydrolase/transferase [Roseinatronobacter sp. HJB301]